ncbi:OrNV gp129-like protein [Tomelloso virus]|uniref:OrNV gp129-like protein n=1 Tax=Tomelloso virus TaxID=2053981 RepID=A0A2H4T2T8_9VIRU|nr:OrNV gp129-like protein [Tomelloso virus]ATY70251.1 OrNV gp129-like protein [Tomelloso virus]
MTAISRLILYPNPKWFKYTTDEYLDFPELHYIECNELTPPSDPLLGGSYSYFCDLPHHFERCAILENLYFPYELDTPNFKVRHASLLWPMINLSAYTDKNDPKSVYFKRRNVSKVQNSTDFFAKLVFLPERIELYEIIDQVDVEMME